MPQALVGHFLDDSSPIFTPRNKCSRSKLTIIFPQKIMAMSSFFLCLVCFACMAQTSSLQLNLFSSHKARFISKTADATRSHGQARIGSATEQTNGLTRGISKQKYARSTIVRMVGQVFYNASVSFSCLEIKLTLLIYCIRIIRISPQDCS